jgi:phosphoglycolate phosphatase
MKPPSPRAVVFDLDGTLIDSKGDIAAACNHALVHVGRAALPVDVISAYVGDGARLLVARALGASVEDPLTERALEAFRVFYEAHPADHTTVIDGALSTLDALGHLPLALVTNKPRGATLGVLRALGLEARFAGIRTGSDGPLKPDPSAILEVLEVMGVAPADAWMVGDGEQDVAAGRAAGCTTIGLRGGLQGDAKMEASRPDLLLGSIRELASALKAAAARPA